jgi:hypothetical protein
VVEPALALAPTTFLDDIANSLTRAGIQNAVARHDSRPIYEWLLSLLQLQGISDHAAFAFAEKNGMARWGDIEAALASPPDCRRLRSYWHLTGCVYQKTARTCSEPHLLDRCPLPRHPLRNGRLNQAAYSLFLFIRDIADGDFVQWIDNRLQQADPGEDDPQRAAILRGSLLSPLENIYGVGRKLWSMSLADLLLAGDPNRERWTMTGASFVAVDSLVHAFLHRTGVLHRFNALHEIGPACYAPSGCASLIEDLAQRIDARAFNPAFRQSFQPRFIQHSIWAFCATGVLNICNSNRISDGARCQRRFCPVFSDCDRFSLRGGPDRAA